MSTKDVEPFIFTCSIMLEMYFVLHIKLSVKTLKHNLEVRKLMYYFEHSWYKSGGILLRLSLFNLIGTGKKDVGCVFLAKI